MSKEIDTKTGGKVTISDGPEFLGPGVMFTQGVYQPGHHRESEIFLDPDAVREVYMELSKRYHAMIERGEV